VKNSTPRAIKEYALGIYDGPHATPKESSEGPIFLGIKNITEEGRLDFSEIRHVSEEDFLHWTRRVTPQPGDVVFTYEATLHRYAIIPEGFRGCLGRRVALVRPDLRKVDSRYLLYYFLSHNWRQVVESYVITTGATVDRIPLEKFPDFPAALPDLSSQQRVVSILSAYDNLIENNLRRMALLEESARLLYREWFVRLRFPGYEHTRTVNGVPEGWEIKKMRDVCESVGGGTPSTTKSEFWEGGTLPG
jgi:type I restriction enzyme S subunit